MNQQNNMKKKLRPKGCMRTISGRHIPTVRIIRMGIEFYCSACGLIDDLGIFMKYLHPNLPKIDDNAL